MRKKLLSICLLLFIVISAVAQTEFTVGNFKYTVTDEGKKTVSIAKDDEAELSGALVIPTNVTYQEVSYAVTSVAESGFNGTGLTSITIPASVTSIGNAAFQGCRSMTSINIADSENALTMANSWYERPFGENPATTIYIGRNLTLTDSGENAICDNASSVTFGDKVTAVNPYLFYSNQMLSSITIGSGVTTIGNSAFYWCGQDEPVEEIVVTMGSNVTSIGDNAFRECNKLKSVTLPSTLTTIGDAAFNGTGLTSITIPASVMSIGNAAFQVCRSMTSINIADSENALTMANTWYERPFGDNPATTIYIGRNLKLTDGLENQFCDNVTSVTFGDKVTAVNPYLFSGTTTITSVKVPWLTPSAINETAFYSDVYANATLWIPGGTGEIYADADGWKNFENMNFASYVVSITGSAHGTLAVADIISTNGETKTTHIDRETDAMFTVIPATGYELTTFTVNGVVVTLTEGMYTIENLLADQTVVASFTPITYTLNYELAGGSLVSENPAIYTIESAAITLTNPTKAGYNFAGWTGTGLTEATTTVTIAQGSTGNRSYTATWTPVKYTISYDLAGGSEVSANPVTYTVESAAITLNNPTREGYTFAGWKVNGEGEPQMNVTIAAGSMGNKAYTATWTAIEYSINYNLDGGVIGTANPSTYTIESEDFTLNNPTKEHYDFAGWTGTGLDVATTTVIITNGSTGNRSYTATWTEKIYTVTITGGGVTADNDNPQYGDNVVLTIANNPDATLASLMVNGDNVTNEIVDNQYTIMNVSGNVSVVVSWNSTKEFITMAHDMAAFSCDKDLDFSDVSGLKAYIATGYDRTTNTVMLTRVLSVPAETGLLLVGTEGETYKVPYEPSTSFFVNLLQPVLSTQELAETEGKYTNFLYDEKNGVQGFYKSSGSDSVSAKQAYLQLPTSALGDGVYVAMIFNHIAIDDATAIRELQMASDDEAVYNLNGTRVSDKRNMNRLPKGIYIVGGRKVTLK